MNTLDLESEELVTFLGSTPLAGLVTQEILRQIVPMLEHVQVAKGEVVIRQGDPGGSMYLLRSGRLEVVSRDSSGNEIILNVLEPGRTVGEVSLLTGERRTATVVATEDARLLCFTQDQFQALQAMYPQEMEKATQRIMRRLEQAHLSTALRGSRLLGDLDDAVLQDLEEELTLQFLPSGETLMRQEDESNALYILISGRLRVVHDYDTPQEKTLYEMGRGQTVGEMGLITGSRRSATVYALRDSLVARLSRQSYDRLLVKHPHAVMRQFAGKAIQILYEEVKGTRRFAGNVATFALVPVTQGLDVRDFASQLVAALSGIGASLSLDSKSVEDALSRPGVAHTVIDSPANISMSRWLGELEMRHQFLVYRASPVFTNWTQRCLRQADRVLLVADPAQSPKLCVVEEALAASSRKFRTPSILVLLHSPETELPSNTAAWLEAREVANVYHVRDGNQADFARLGRLITGRGIGVVLSGGGARGVAHVGALKALGELGVNADAVGGSSAGGIMSTLWASGKSYDALLKRMGEGVSRKLKDYTFPITSIMAGFKITAEAKAFFGPDRGLEDLWLPCFLTTANISSSRLMIHDRGPIWKYIRATSSVPGVFPPVLENGEMLVDGGLLNNLPTDVMAQRPDIGTVIALDVGGSPDPPYEIEPYESSLSGWKVLWSRINPFSKPIRVPSLGRVMMGVAMISNGAAIEKTRELADFYMRLDPGDISLFEFASYAKSAENGYRSAKQILATWEKEEKFQELLARLRPEKSS